MDTRPRREPVRRVAPRKPGIPYYVVAAWCLASLICGVAIWLDAHFEAEQQSAFGSITTTFTFDKVVMHIVVVDEFETHRVTRETSYREFVQRGRGQDEDARRLWASGRLYKWTMYAAPFLGLLGLVLLRAWPWVRFLPLFLAAVLPLVTAQYLGYAVDEVFRGWSDFKSGLVEPPVLRTMPVTWWGRFASALFTVAVLVAWVRHPPVKPVLPTDADVFG